MKLTKLEYSEYRGKNEEWILSDCTLGDINLIVGKNATGKSRTLNVIRSLASLLSEATNLPWRDGNYYTEFNTDGETFAYSLEYHNNMVTSEELKINGTRFLVRNDDGAGNIKANELNQTIKFKTQTDQVAAFSKRDSIQHPFLERLHEWGQGVTKYEFGSQLGKGSLLIKGRKLEDDTITKLNLKDTEKVVGIFLQGNEEFPDKFKNTIIADMKAIGYDLEDIDVDIPKGISLISNIEIPGAISALYVKESDLQNKTYQMVMSQGMFRALSVLIQINYGLLANLSVCVLIDDLGNGRHHFTG